MSAHEDLFEAIYRFAVVKFAALGFGVLRDHKTRLVNFGI